MDADKGIAEVFLDLESCGVGFEREQSLRNGAELQKGLLWLGTQMKSEGLTLLGAWLWCYLLGDSVWSSRCDRDYLGMQRGLAGLALQPPRA